MTTNKDFTYTCPKTWKLFQEGRTKGVFQLESSLGKSWSKKLGPRNIEELSALIAIIRPGSLKAFMTTKAGSKSMTQHYVDRKNKIDEVTYLHPSLEDILSPTYGVLVYQEQSMRIAQKLAGFNLQEADGLRKAIGKKKADLMEEVKEKFVEGCKKEKIVDEETSMEIFSWVEKASRYSFNKSHAVAYAINSYVTAWYKVHYTKEFFKTYLDFSSSKPDPHQEIYELVSDAKLFGITVKIPTINNYNIDFRLDGNCIYFGIKNIKSLTGVNGIKALNSIEEVSHQTDKKSSEFTWMDVLVYISPKISKPVFKALASIGFFKTKNINLSRNEALYQYEIFRSSVNKTENKWVMEHYEEKKWESLKDCLIDLQPTRKNGGGTFSVTRSQAIENEIYFLDNPPFSLEDDPRWLIEQEVKLLGCPISLSRVESSDTSLANITCKEIEGGRHGKNLFLAGSINKVFNYTIPKGKSKGKVMSFITVEDESCSIDNVIAFPEVREKYEFVLYENNNLLFNGHIDPKDHSFIIDTIHEI